MQKADNTSSLYQAKVLLYEKLVASIPGLQRKGATMPYTSLQGNMFSFLEKGGALALRLPVELKESFLKKYTTSLHKTHGVIMKEYVSVPDALLHKTQELKIYFLASYEYAKTLKPKPSKK